MSSSSSSQAEVYNTDRFAALYYASRAPEMDNLALAAKFLIRLFKDRGIQYVILGGWAVFLRGGHRTTQDVDVAVRSTMDHLNGILLQQARVCVPERHGQTSIQIFVHTGGRWESRNQAVECPVSVDIILAGNMGTPKNLPDGTSEIVPVPMTLLGDSCVRVLDIFHQFSSKLRAYSDRRNAGPMNDITDLNFLAAQFPDVIYARRHGFSLEHRMNFWNDLPPEYQEMYFSLLGLDELEP